LIHKVSVSSFVSDARYQHVCDFLLAVICDWQLLRMAPDSLQRKTTIFHLLSFLVRPQLKWWW